MSSARKTKYKANRKQKISDQPLLTTFKEVRGDTEYVSSITPADLTYTCLNALKGKLNEPIKQI